VAETTTIQVDYLARVEGEGKLFIRMSGGKAEEVKLEIFEPPRFFEGFLQGRSCLETPDITARICGICPVAYQMSACHAVEDALGITLPDTLRRLRRLLYCGEWIESHGLHMFLLHAPDFLGFQDAIQMAKHHKDWVQKGLGIKKSGNAIVTTLGGREIHPINVRVGGFYRAPSKGELSALLEPLAKAQADVEAAVEWMATFDYPDFERDYELVALRHPDEYAFCEGRLVSNKGLDIDVHDYAEHFEEQHVEHSTALHSVLKARGAYFVGPLARVNLGFDKLSAPARAVCAAIGFEPPCNNPFKSLLARGIELVEVIAEAQRIIESYQEPEASFVDVTLKAGVGHGCTEAPRGILYHRYAIAEDGSIDEAVIIPPTSQNQKTIEDDLRALAPMLSDMSLEDATWRAEQAVRNYDPCISCSTHFLKLRIEGS
jgi:coenzyme F420-reducing hydrogenase alpha subunit